MEELIAWAIFSGLVIHALVGENGMVNHFFPGWSKAIGTDKPDMGDTICMRCEWFDHKSTFRCADCGYKWTSIIPVDEDTDWYQEWIEETAGIDWDKEFSKGGE
tara:strand:+ start:636 stop:947 length:312 start_codon:yes stop_codon:yes gene_type:complete